MQITFTWAQLVSVCVGLTAIFGVIQIGVKAWKATQEPDKKQDERITSIEERLAKYDQFFAQDKQRLAELEEGNRVSQRALLALLAHGIDGNEVDGMKRAKDELTEYLVRR